jgi:hypothetical protein
MRHAVAEVDDSRVEGAGLDEFEAVRGRGEPGTLSGDRRKVVVAIRRPVIPRVSGKTSKTEG